MHEKSIDKRQREREREGGREKGKFTVDSTTNWLSPTCLWVLILSVYIIANLVAHLSL
jgi:hypothetical protein